MMSWLKKNWKPLLLITFLVLASYANSLKNEFVSDDIDCISANPDINGLRYFWSPPVFFFRSFLVFLIHKIFAFNPVFYHALNILFHLGSAWIIYILFSLFFALPIPLMVAGLFAVHPALVESVTWISGGGYAQYSFFIMLSFLCYLLSNKRRGGYFVSLCSCALALLSSEKAIILPLILFTWEFASGNLSKNWKKTVPFFILTAAIVGMYLMRLGGHLDFLKTQFAIKNRFEDPFIQVPIATTYYFQMLFFPLRLTLFYAQTDFIYTEYIARSAFFILYLGIIVYCYIVRQRAIFFWLSFFFITLLPTLTPLRIASHWAERYVYLGSVGVFFTVAFVFKKLSEVKRLKLIPYIIFSLIIVALSTRTIIRNIDWKNEERLWLATVKASPESVNAHNNLGNVYLNKGDFPAALMEYKKAIALMPRYANPYYNIACIYRLTGKFNEAIENYQKAVFLNPSLWQAYKGLALVYFREGDYVRARENVAQALRINSNDLFLQQLKKTLDK